MPYSRYAGLNVECEIMVVACTVLYERVYERGGRSERLWLWICVVVG